MFSYSKGIFDVKLRSSFEKVLEKKRESSARNNNSFFKGIYSSIAIYLGCIQKRVVHKTDLFYHKNLSKEKLKQLFFTNYASI